MPLLETARSKGVTPCSVAAFTSALSARRSCAISVWFCWTALKSGVQPPLFRALTSALLAMSSSTNARKPFPAASNNGVEPEPSPALTFACRAIRNSATVLNPRAAAWWSGVKWLPLLSAALTSPPLPSNSSIIALLPFSAAMPKGVSPVPDPLTSAPLASRSSAAATFPLSTRCLQRCQAAAGSRPVDQVRTVANHFLDMADFFVFGGRDGERACGAARGRI